MDNSDLEIDLIPSQQDPSIGAHVGVRISHKVLNLTAESTSHTTQYANKLHAMRQMEKRVLEIEKAELNDILNNFNKSSS